MMQTGNFISRLLCVAALTAFIALPFACTAKAAEIKPCTCILATEPRLPDGVQKAWGQPSKFWPQKSVLRVKFLTGTAKQKAETWKRVQKLDALVNLTFVQVTTGASEIRVRFDKGKGHWSYLGRDCLTVPSSAQTMNLELATGVFGNFSEDWDRVVIHEFGHAIGIKHEHQSPKAGIAWNKPFVYSEYARTQGWSKSQVDFQVFDQYKGSDFKGTAFDRYSIWLYPIPPGYANIVVDWNWKLSPLDIAFLKEVYP